MKATTADLMRWLARTQGLKKPRKPLKVEPQLKAQEREYVRKMLPILRAMRDLAGAYLVPAIRKASANYAGQRPDQRRDAADDDIREAMGRIRTQFHREFTADEIRRIAADRGISVARLNKEYLDRGVKRVLDIDVFATEPYLSDQVGLFATQNANLITSMSDEFFSKVENLAYEGITDGLNVSDIEDQIFDLIDPDRVARGNVKARAELIARDQVGKLNGQLDMLRQTEIGVKRYVWRTVGDERVRDSHQALNGQEFDWAEPPITNSYGDRNHPGEDYNCRCYAEPILEDLTDEQDEEAGRAFAEEEA